MSNKYFTAAIPYINAQPHLGHILEWFQTDAMARHTRLAGDQVEFTCGTDENSLKNVQAAEKANKSVQAWLDEYAQIFQNAFEHFNISLTRFMRGSDQTNHWPGVQKLWQLCEANGDIYTKKYTGLYCVGCESYYTKSELVDGKCPEHLTVPEEITETNYFFKLSKYQQQIEELIASDQLRVNSDQYKQEMLGFIRSGLEDFSVSRSVGRARGLGVPVPGDDSQVMYVWFDALSIYLTAIGWGYDDALFNQFWPAEAHVIGKGIARFHAVYWIGMLLSAGLAIPKTISVHGYVTVEGQKMSKSLGNVIDPFQIVQDYGLEPVRYYLLRHVPTHSDGDFSIAKFKESYNADLANGLGNLCSRLATLCDKNQVGGLLLWPEISDQAIEPELARLMNDQELSQALSLIFDWVGATDRFLSENKPWAESDEVKRREILVTAVKQLLKIGWHLQPFLPETAEQIIKHFSSAKINKLDQALFPRIQS